MDKAKQIDDGRAFEIVKKIVELLKNEGLDRKGVYKVITVCNIVISDWMIKGEL